MGARKIYELNRMASEKQVEFPSMGMRPSVWGPIFWMTMHITTLGYSDFPNDTDKQGAIAFFESLQHTIPCPICKQHYKECLEKYPVRNAVGSKQTLIRWLFMIHNLVNKELNKSQISWEEFIRQMTELSNRSAFSFITSKPGTMICMDSLLLLVGAFGAGAATAYFVGKHLRI